MNSQKRTPLEQSGRRYSRRTFLKTSAAFAGAVAAGPMILRNANAASTAANSAPRLAVIGLNSRGNAIMQGLIKGGADLVALCDVDETVLERIVTEVKKNKRVKSGSVRTYNDYRKLLDIADQFDAVAIGTPDHWHAPLCKAFFKAGKHIYCEKPLTHSIGEARDLRELSRASSVVTQMGNQGSASDSLRRCVEIIQAGALGQIRDIYNWGIGIQANEGNAPGEDPVPPGFNWDEWVGPSAMRPFKKNEYHLGKWRHWYDFGNGGLADFCCHAINLPMRALKLSYPEKLVYNVKDGVQTPGKAGLEYHFAARPGLEPVTIHWQGEGQPPEHVLKNAFGESDAKTKNGVLLVGEKGIIHTNHWGGDAIVKLNGEEKPSGFAHHAATKDIAETLPRIGGDHQKEFVNAIQGEGKVYSNFDTGGMLTEIGLSGVLAVRSKRSITWDGEKMTSPDAPDVARFVRTQWREKWLT